MVSTDKEEYAEHFVAWGSFLPKLTLSNVILLWRIFKIPYENFFILQGTFNLSIVPQNLRGLLFVNPFYFNELLVQFIKCWQAANNYSSRNV